MQVPAAVRNGWEGMGIFKWFLKHSKHFPVCVNRVWVKAPFGPTHVASRRQGGGIPSALAQAVTFADAPRKYWPPEPAPVTRRVPIPLPPALYPHPRALRFHSHTSLPPCLGRPPPCTTTSPVQHAWGTPSLPPGDQVVAHGPVQGGGGEALGSGTSIALYLPFSHPPCGGTATLGRRGGTGGGPPSVL